MKQIVNRLRMTLTLMLLISFWGLCVSLAPSSDDGSAKSFPSLHRRTMNPQKVFQASIVGRWTRKKCSKPPSSDDGPVKRFPSLYRRTMDPQKDFQASIVRRWTRKKVSTPLSSDDGQFGASTGEVAGRTFSVNTNHTNRTNGGDNILKNFGPNFVKFPAKRLKYRATNSVALLELQGKSPTARNCTKFISKLYKITMSHVKKLYKIRGVRYTGASPCAGIYSPFRA